MKQAVRFIIVSVLTALGSSSCVGCMPGLVYGPPPPLDGDFTPNDSTRVEEPVKVDKTIETPTK